MAKDVRIIPADGDIQFYNAAASASGKIQQVNDDLVLSNAVGDILFGDTNSDVYIGDGVSNVDIIFEQDGEIRGEAGSNVTLTLGSKDTTIYVTGSTVALQKDSGNVGIGTSSPQKPLHVSSNNDAPIRVESTDATTGILFVDPNSSNALYYVGSGDSFYTSAKLGIGQAPSRDLHVKKANSGGQVRMEVFNSSNTADSHGVVSIYSGGASGGDPFLHWKIDVQQDWSMGIDNSDGDKLKISKNFGPGTNDYMTLDTSGNVGIGTTSPGSKLHVVGNGYFTSDNTSGSLVVVRDSNQDQKLYLRGGAGSGEAWVAAQYQLELRAGVGGNTSYDLLLSTATGEAMRIDAGRSNNIGIGLVNPGTKLQVGGAGYFSGETILSQSLSLDQNYSNVGLLIAEEDYIYTKDGSSLRKLIGKSSDMIYIGQTGTSLIDGIYLEPGQSGYVSIKNTTDGEYARFTGGKLGIGTTGPTQKLEVRDGNIILSGSTPRVMFDNPALAYQHDWFLRNNGGAGQMEYRFGGGAKIYFDNHSIRFGDWDAGTGTNANVQDPRIAKQGFGSGLAGGLQFFTENSARMTISGSNGYVGIGTATPEDRLHVAGNATVAGYVGNWGGDTRDKLRVWTSGTYSIGMTSAFTYGHLNDYAMTFQMNNDTDRGFWWGHNSNTNAQGAMALTTDGRAVIATSLSIGEGTTVTSPSSETLYVDGDAVITGIITAQEFHTEFVSASIVYQSGSTKFGDTSDDIHEFTGSLNVQDGDVLIRSSQPGTNLVIDNTGTGDPIINFALSGVNQFTVGVDDSDSDKFKIGTGGGLSAASEFTMDSSGNVGIGNNSPATKLDVSGSVRIKTDNPLLQLLDTNGTIRYAAAQFATNGGSWFISSGDSNTGAGVANSDLWITRAAAGTDNRFRFHRDSYAFTVYSGSSARVSLNADGNSWFTGGSLGVGTTSPQANLHVADSTSSSTAFKFFVGRDGGNTSQGLGIAVDDSGTYIRATQDETSTEAHHMTFDVSSSASGDHYYLWNINDTNRMWLEDTGLGIGTTSPTAKLHVEGTTRFGNSQNHLHQMTGSMLHFYNPSVSNSVTTDLLKLQAYTGDFGADPAAIALAFKFQDSNNSTNEARIRMATVNDTDYGDNDEAASNLIFSTTNGGTESDKMIITGRGAIGIGTNNPGNYKLNIAGGNADQLLIENTTSSGTANIAFKANSTRNSGPFIKATARGASAGDSDLQLGDENGTTMTINGGRVGVGTVSPATTLDVSGSIRSEGPDGGLVMRYWNSGTTYGMIGTANMGSNEYALLTNGQNTYIGAGSGGSTLIRSNANDPSVQLTFNGAGDVAYFEGGNVGIGTTAPTQALTVEGNISGSGRLYLGTVDSNTTSTAALVLNGSEVEQRSLGNAAFQDTGSMTVSSADSVNGIQTTSFLRSDTSDTFTNGTLSFSAGTNFDGSQANTTDSYSIASKFLANPASEAGEWADVRILNNLAGAHKWATITLTDCYQSDRTTAITSLSANTFDGTSGHQQIYQNAAGDPIVIQIDLPFSINFSAWVGIVFGNPAWRAKSVKIETFRNGAWQTECNLTNQSSHIVARQVANNNANGVSKIRYTLDDLQNTTNHYIRIVSLFNLNYRTGAESYGGVHYIDKYKDSVHYGHLRPATDSTYDLGSTSLYYRAMYSDKIYLNALDTNTTSTTALVLNGSEVEKRTLATGAFTTVGNSATQNTGSMTVLSADSADSATTAGSATTAVTASYASSVNYADIIGTPTLDNYGEWHLAGDADSTDITSGKWVKFAGGASITGAGTEANPYLMDISPSSASYATFAATAGTATSATTATSADEVTITTITTNGNYDILYEGSTANRLAKDAGGDFAYNPSTNVLTVGNVVGNLTGLASSASHAEYADDAGLATNARFVDVNNVTTGTTYRVVFADSTGTSYEQMNVHDNGIEYDPGTATLRLAGDVVAYNSFSDRELKDNIQTYQGGLNAVMQLNPVTYEWKKGREGQEIGLIAQEVEEVVPQVVRSQQRMDEGTYKTVDYEKLVAVLIDAVQDQQKQIDELKQKLDGLTK